MIKLPDPHTLQRAVQPNPPNQEQPCASSSHQITIKQGPWELGRYMPPPPLETVRRQGPWEGTAACAARKAGSWRMASQQRHMGQRKKRRKGGMRASTSTRRSSGSPA